MPNGSEPTKPDVTLVPRSLSLAQFATFSQSVRHLQYQQEKSLHQSHNFPAAPSHLHPAPAPFTKSLQIFIKAVGRSRQTLSSQNRKWRRHNKCDWVLATIPVRSHQYETEEWVVWCDMSSENDSNITPLPLLGSMPACDGDVGHQSLFMWATGQNYTANLQPPPEWGSQGLVHLQQTASAHSQELLHLTFIAAQMLSKCIKTWSDSDYSLSLTFTLWDTASKNEGSEETFIPSFCFNSLLLLQLTLTISTHREKSEVTYQSRFSVFFPWQIQWHTLKLDASCAPSKLYIRIKSSRGSHLTVFFLTEMHLIANWTQTCKTALGYLPWDLWRVNPLNNMKITLLQWGGGGKQHQNKPSSSTHSFKLNKFHSPKWQMVCICPLGTEKYPRKASQPLTFWKAFYTFQTMSIMNSLSQCKCLIYHTSLETILGLGLLGHHQALLPVSLCANICPAAPTETHARPKVAKQHPRCLKHQASSPALKN